MAKGAWSSVLLRNRKPGLGMFHDAGEIDCRVVGEGAEPVVLGGLGEPAGLGLDGLEGVEVEGCHPGGLQVGGQGDQVG